MKIQIIKIKKEKATSCKECDFFSEGCGISHLMAKGIIDRCSPENKFFVYKIKRLQ